MPTKPVRRISLSEVRFISLLNGNVTEHGVVDPKRVRTL